MGVLTNDCTNPTKAPTHRLSPNLSLYFLSSPWKNLVQTFLALNTVELIAPNPNDGGNSPRYKDKYPSSWTIRLNTTDALPLYSADRVWSLHLMVSNWIQNNITHTRLVHDFQRHESIKDYLPETKSTALPLQRKFRQNYCAMLVVLLLQYFLLTSRTTGVCEMREVSESVKIVRE